MRLLILLAFVALPAHADFTDQKLICDAAMDDEFYPEWRSTYETMVGCINPAICGGVWNSYGYEVKRRPAGRSMTVWCRVDGDEITLSESNPYKQTFEAPPPAPK